MRASHAVAQHSSLVRPVSSDPSVGAKPSVLVVEDETFVRNAACAILEGAGYTVLAARNAAEAKNLLEDHSESVGILFSDVVLPGQNGCELADELRAQYPAMRMILTSGYPCEADEESCHNGVFYLPKPFSADALLNKVRQVWPHAQNRNQPRRGADIA